VRRAIEDNAAVRKDIGVVAQCQGKAHVLLDDEHLLLATRKGVFATDIPLEWTMQIERPFSFQMPRSSIGVSNT